MGTYNDTIVEVFSEEKQEWDLAETDALFPVEPSRVDFVGSNTTDRPFNYQSYPIAAFIAGLRNYYALEPIAEDRGLPEGHESKTACVGFWGEEEAVSRYPDRITDDRLNTWVLLKELLDFDYGRTFEDRRDDGETLPIGSGVITTYREHLGDFYFEELETLKKLGPPEHVRIVFAFY